MWLIAIVAVVNTLLGFALAVYLRATPESPFGQWGQKHAAAAKDAKHG